VKIDLKRIFALAVVIAAEYCAAGIHEVGGNNHGDQVEFYLVAAGSEPGQPWCCAFVFTCLLKAWARLSGIDESRDSLLANVGRFCRETGIPRTASCAAMWAAFEHMGLTRDLNATCPAGSLVFFHFHGELAPHHIGFVRTSSFRDRIVGTIEGNTGAVSQADGDGVLMKMRNRSIVFGFAVAA
jgi:hypothetical protein